ncbi:MAG: hypothetical protein P5683_25185, partial [Limnospira sp. PMC 1279.21]|nr:hypothetical protein [Limnospira sp. PMC 1279.21]MDT9242143.1 hypothetical protein [Limnospira sp. PMC 1261.20]MDT9247223.1 hypothetical protein [Limnospira sp. PMC 1249.20]MDT9262574.1 hypothetical protein [Limnospira sp. PMC 1236.20]MDT9303535.1 hypothetical protein [Limnospira sp. PMC 1281.21]
MQYPKSPPGGTSTPWWNIGSRISDHPITVYMSRRLEKSKQGRRPKVKTERLNGGSSVMVEREVTFANSNSKPCL